MRARKLRLLFGQLCGFALAFATISTSAHTQTAAPDEWTWVGGSSTVGSNSSQPGVYGTLGTPAPGNIPGGRNSAAAWTGYDGKLWLFGGQGIAADNKGIAFNDLWSFDPSTTEWAWMGGSSTVSCQSYCGQSGVYGALGTPAAGNIPGGRYSGASWTDIAGHLWLFGGYGFDGIGQFGFLNDLWEFDPSTNEWTWMGGDSTLPMNGEGATGVYGTLGTPAAGNIPGGRWMASTWTDSSGKFWLFGGDGYYGVGIPGTFNDLWQFDPSTKEWTWMSGSSTVGTCDGTGFCSQPGVYGTLGVPAPGNVPSSRDYAASWADSNGNFWLFGGSLPGIQIGYLNDLWEFSPSKNEWGWMGGSGAIDLPGVYGTLGKPSAGSIPGSRCCAVNWNDMSGHFWLFAGQGYDVNGKQGDLNDLWEFDLSTNEWTWMGGSSVQGCGGSGCFDAGLYGTQGTAAVGNNPGSRADHAGWTDHAGNFWLFGGGGADANGQLGDLNDLWQYQPSVTPTFSATATPIFSPAAGTYTSAQSVTIASATPAAVIYYTLDGSTPTTASSVYGGAIAVSASKTIQALAVAMNYLNSAVGSAAYTIVPPAAAPTFSVQSGTYSAAQTVTVSDTTPGAIIYYTTDGTTPTTSSTVYSGPILVSSTETIEAVATASGYSPSAVASATYTIPPDFTVAINPSSILVQAGQSGTTTITVQDVGGFNSNVSFACSGLPAGAACSFTTETVPAPSGTTYTTLTVTTSATTAALHRTCLPLVPGPALAIAIGCFAWKKRRRLQMALLLIVSVIGIGLAIGCGGSGASAPRQPVTTIVTVNATSGSLNHSTTFSLTVD